ncbi:MAG: UxaA family hydrolase [Candidatus Binatia bacterium]
MKPNILIVHPHDNVAVVLTALAAGEPALSPGVEGLTALSEIPASHKIALQDIAAGRGIIKYGETVAVSTRDIKKGEWVHTHNLESKRWKR